MIVSATDICDPVETLEWYQAVGVTDVCDAVVRDWTVREGPVVPMDSPATETVPPPSRPTPPIAASAAQTTPPPRPAPSSSQPTLPDLPGTASAVARAEQLAAACQTIEDLHQALSTFDGCPLKKTAKNLVFYDGDPMAPVMIIGEGPGADEDRLGKPFVGRSGQLLDRMLGSIGLDRAKICITNVVYWRPPGNRKPTASELAICFPFLNRHIELAQPRLMMLAGDTAAKSILKTTRGITRTRGQWGIFNDIPVMPTFHPAYLLRSPTQKRLAWKDLLDVRMKLDSTQ